MMISPDVFYDEYIKNKDKNAINTIIQELEQNIQELQEIIDKSDYEPNIMPDEKTVIFWTKKYLDLARKEYQERFGVEK